MPLLSSVTPSHIVRHLLSNFSERFLTAGTTVAP